MRFTTRLAASVLAACIGLGVGARPADASPSGTNGVNNYYGASWLFHVVCSGSNMQLDETSVHYAPTKGSMFRLWYYSTSRRAYVGTSAWMAPQINIGYKAFRLATDWTPADAQLPSGSDVYQVYAEFWYQDNAGYWHSDGAFLNSITSYSSAGVTTSKYCIADS
jgi:hypothetical protein